jgi:hypothetical protein
MVQRAGKQHTGARWENSVISGRIAGPRDSL